ncbi:hydrogenase 4 subunit F, partial [Candidatus Azambacteria bacterium]|nr:hydrogenase 4 subunit F [Candidatus Azambacteria bacterium]
MEILIIALSYIVSVAVSLASKSRRAIEYAAIAAASVSLVSATQIAMKVASKGTYEYSSIISITPLGALVMLTIFLIGLLSSIYSKGHFQEEVSKGIVGFTRVKQYFILLNLFIIAMFFAVSVNNPIIMWILIEATTLSTAFLISFYNKPSAMEAAWKYLLINSIGLLLGFFGTLIYLTSVKDIAGGRLIDWNMLFENAKNLDPALAKIAFIFILVGYGTKVGFFPMHTWKPDAYSKAPTPIAALFSSALLNVAFF